MGLAEILQRRVKPLKFASDDGASGTSSSPAHSLASDEDVSNERTSSNDPEGQGASDTSGEDSEAEDDSNEDPSDIEQNISTISFGALARAQETLGKRKHSATDDAGASLPSGSPQKKPRSDGNPEAQERKAGKKDTRDFSRSSKHAPAELSSKKAVSRRRAVVQLPKLDRRDPRFEPLSGPVDDARTKQNYAFLDAYRDSEMADLRAAIRAPTTTTTTDADADANNPNNKESLKRALLRMESRKRTQTAKDQRQGIVRAHRAREKTLVAGGKKPFYLKRAAQKELALVERFAGLKGKEVDRAIERRRRKKAGRERRAMPEGRRV